MTIYYRPTVLKQLRRLPTNQAQKALKTIELLAQNPHIGKYLKGEFEGLMAVRSWPYLIIYSCDRKKQSITIYSIAHRQGAYK